MFKTFYLIFILIVSTAYCQVDEWQKDWICGMDFLEAKQYPEAYEMLTSALEVMSEEEIEYHPEVLMNRAYVNYLLNNLEESIIDCKSLLIFETLNNQQKQNCYFLLYLSLWKQGKPLEALQAYFESVALEKN